MTSSVASCPALGSAPSNSPMVKNPNFRNPPTRSATTPILPAPRHPDGRGPTMRTKWPGPFAGFGELRRRPKMAESRANRASTVVKADDDLRGGRLDRGGV
ncbi:hypothetical protein Aglo03_13140 [Actinokineospora globicatena]|uniref:Uncharacterized protein n=1 Tax=Actinokineospora globicatena TaxID=103729 RepID=A0A9W6V913_9PSEU|nr:hypothetical protein Aglo03_13140 [Actinokineospora globicatena]